MSNLLLKFKALSASALVAGQGAISSQVPNFSYEIIAICFLIFAVILVTLTLGRSKMIILILSLYVTGFIYRTVAGKYFFTALIRTIPSTLAASIIFVGLYICFSFFVNTIFKRARVEPKRLGLLSLIPLAILHAGLLASILLPLLPENVSVFLPQWAMSYFATEKAQTIWAFLPIIGVFLMSLGLKKARSSK